jgi:hypothetical protein
MGFIFARLPPPPATGSSYLELLQPSSTGWRGQQWSPPIFFAQGSSVLSSAAGGASEQEILQDYPDLELEDIRAFLAYAARYFDHPVLVSP